MDDHWPRTANNNIIIVSPIIGRGATIIIRFLPPNSRIFRGVRKARRTRPYLGDKRVFAGYRTPRAPG